MSKLEQNQGSGDGGLTSNSQGTAITDKVFGAYLKDGLVSKHQIDIAVKKRIALSNLGRNISVKEILLQDKFITSSVEGVDAQTKPISFKKEEDTLLLPISICQYYKLVPLSVTDDALTVMTSRPQNANEKRKILESCIYKVNYLIIKLASLQQVNAEIERLKKITAVLYMLLDEIRMSTITPQQLSMVIYAIFTEAMKKRASDIHLDKKADPDSWISYRIDGVLVQAHLVDTRIMSAIFARIKIDAGLDASNNRDAQDGRLSFEYANRQIDLRVASQPLADGETIAIRVLDPLALPSFEKLFFADLRVRSFVKLLTSVRAKTGSLVLFSGPTGSGKTTSLYAIAQNLPRDALNVVTVEDPVEYKLPFARQIQINQIFHETSRGTERSLLRQDPDVIILGEIRDADTAHAALKFMESGHMVMATIHASSVMQTYDRFISFFEGDGRREALVTLGHTLRLLFNQRLMKKLCSCATPATISDFSVMQTELADIGISLESNAGIMVRNGCQKCNDEGTMGRVLVAETLMVDIDDQTKSEVSIKLASGTYSLLDIINQYSGMAYTTRTDSIKNLLQVGAIDHILAKEMLRV